jgi:GT2 family glycosyltransferase
MFRSSPIFNAEAYGGWPRDTVREVDIVTGCLLLTRRETWNRLCGFDPTFVMYGDEADLCRRAQAIGFRPMITPTAEIVHYEGASESVRANKGVRLNRALMTLIRRHFPTWQRPLARWLLLFTPLSRVAALQVLALVGSGAPESLATWREIWMRRAEWCDGDLR